MGGLVVLAPGADPGLQAELERAGARAALLWPGASPPAAGDAEPAVVLVEAASSYDARRAATLARATWPAALVVARGAGEAAGYVDAVESRRVVASGSWHELLRAWPAPGEVHTLAVGEADLALVLRRVSTLRSEAAPPWIVLRSDPALVELLAGDGTRVRARAAPDALEVTTDRRASEQEEVVAGAWPGVAELLARYQASVARRERAWPRLRAAGDHVAVFEVPGWSSPVTLVSQVTFEEDAGRRRLAHRDLRLNGLRLGRVPRLPLLSGADEGPAPLALAPIDTYRYQVAGPAVVAGEPCWRLDFEPRPGGGGPRGRAHLHRATGELVRLESVATSRRGPFTASRQVDHHELVSLGAGPVRLVTRIEVDELYDAAGHRTPVRRLLRLGPYEVPPPDAPPLAGAVVVELLPAATLATPGPAAPATTTSRPRVRTLAAGLLLDPGIDRPLPFVGGSWSELDLLGTGTQLQVVLGGASARLGWTWPELGARAWQLRLDAALALVAFNDREFRDGRELYEENLRQKPARAALLVGRRLGGARVHVGYELSRTRLERNADTDPGFVVPESPLVHGLRAEVDAQRGGWTGRLTLQASRRASWRAWGRSTAEAVQGRSFQRGWLSVSRVVLARPRLQARVAGEGMAGRHLDRFSRFGFDALDNRLQGYPTGALRYDAAVVGRLTTSASLHPRLRISAFADAARVWGSSARGGAAVHAGTGASVETSLLGAVLAAEWARGFHAPRPRGGAGADVLRVTAFVAF